MLGDVVHGATLVFRLRNQFLVLFGLSVFLSHHLQLVALLLLELRVGHVRHADAFVEHAALLVFFVADALLVVRLQAVDVVVLNGHADVAADLVLVHLRLDFVLHQFALNHCQLLLVLLSLDSLDGALAVLLDRHLVLELGAHLVALGLDEALLLLVGTDPLVDVLLHLLVPLCTCHSDHFSVVRSNNLLVRVDLHELGAGSVGGGDGATISDGTVDALGIGIAGGSLDTFTLRTYQFGNLLVQLVQITL